MTHVLEGTPTAHSADATPLSDSEIDCAIARQIMHWKPSTVRGEFVWHAPLHECHGYALDKDSWQPTRNIAQAWQVLEHVRRDSDSVVLQTRKGRWVCSINGKIYAMGVGDTAPRAICVAALAAVQP